MKYLVLALSVAASAAHAQYRCGTTYQQAPCPGGVKVDVPATPPASARDTKVANAIATGKIVIGMTNSEVVRAWGKPNAINRTVAAGGTREQWVYSDAGLRRAQYLYLDDGVLTSYQSPD